MSNAGFRIYTKVNRPAKELIEGFRGLPVANIADEMNRFFCVDARIKTINKMPLLGPAFTVKARTAPIICCFTKPLIWPSQEILSWLMCREIWSTR